MADPTVKELKKEIYLILHKCLEMLDLTSEGFMQSRLSSLNEADELAGEIQSKEDVLTAMLAKMSAGNSEARTLLAVPARIEKIATSIKRITQNSRERIKEGMLFSDKAVLETGRLFEKTKEVLKKASEAAVTGAKAAVENVIEASSAVERMANEFATAHEERLVTGECSPKSSSMYLCILYAFEDMTAHIKDTTKRLAGQ